MLAVCLWWHHCHSLCAVLTALWEKRPKRGHLPHRVNCRPSPWEVLVYIHLNIYFGNGSVRDSAGGGFVVRVQSPEFGP